MKVKRFFRKYASWEESGGDWARKLAHTPLYEKSFEASKSGDVMSYAMEMTKAGYATDPKYTDVLVAQAKTIDDLPLTNPLV